MHEQQQGVEAAFLGRWAFHAAGKGVRQPLERRHTGPSEPGAVARSPRKKGPSAPSRPRATASTSVPPVSSSRSSDRSTVSGPLVRRREVGRHALDLPVRVHHHALDARLGQPVERAVDQRATAEREQRLGGRGGERAHAGCRGRLRTGSRCGAWSWSWSWGERREAGRVPALERRAPRLAGRGRAARASPRARPRGGRSPSRSGHSTSTMPAQHLVPAELGELVGAGEAPEIEMRDRAHGRLVILQAGV